MRADCTECFWANILSKFEFNNYKLQFEIVQLKINQKKISLDANI